MIMNKDFVSSKLARKLQEKGYPLKKVYRQDGAPFFYDLPQDHPDWSQCDAWYLPSIWEVLKWLREEKKIHVEIVGAAYGYNLIISDTPDKGGTDRYYSHAKYDGPNDGGAWDLFEDCVKYGIEYVIDNLI